MNKKCVIRLSHYRNALRRLQELGFVKIFSENIGNAVNVAATQVRKDFSMFGITGNKRGGYRVADLMERLDAILGKDVEQQVVLVGAGNLGTALMQYRGFAGNGIRLVAAFDKEAGAAELTAGVPVLPLDDFGRFVRENDIRVMVLAVPGRAAQQVADQARAAGIKGILNFAPANLRGMEGVVVNNVNLALELENVLYFVNADRRQQAVC